MQPECKLIVEEFQQVPMPKYHGKPDVIPVVQEAIPSLPLHSYSDANGAS